MSKKYNVKFHHPVTKKLIDEKQYVKLNDIADDLGVSRHVLYRYMNGKLTDRYKNSCVLNHVSWDEVVDDEGHEVDEVDEVVLDEEQHDKEEPEEILRRYRNEYQQKYRENNQDKLRQKISCECGGRYSIQTKSTHIKTSKHKRWAEKILIV